MILPIFRNDEKRSLRLQGPRIYLRAPRHNDWRAWADIRERSQDFLTPWEPTWPRDAMSRGAFRRRQRLNAQEWQQGTGYSFLVFRTADDQILGGITLSNVRRGVAQTGSLGYWVGEPFARQGYMTEALGAVIRFAFNGLGLHRLEAACLPANAASQALLLKAGFSQQGYARQYLCINGKWQDHLLFDLLRSDLRLERKI